MLVIFRSLGRLVFEMTLVVALLATPLVSNSSASAEEPSPWVSGEYIVKYKADRLQQIRHLLPELQGLSDEELKDALTATMDAEQVQQVPLVEAENIRALSGDELNVDAAVDLIDANLVDYISPNYIHTASAVPNDPSFTSLWGLHQSNDIDIDAPEAWDITTGSTTEPVVVGVIDTGIDYTHPDLAANMWINAAEANGSPGVDDDGNGVIDDKHGYNGITGSGNPFDDNNHGTHCAGTIGAASNNGGGVAGVAWNVKLMALKFLSSSGSGSDVDAIKTMAYAVAMKNRGVNLRVLSNSWGGSGYNPAMIAAIEATNNAGMIFIAAAGNAGTNNDTSPHYPSNYTNANVISVAAISQSGNLASFSCFGATTVDIAAPGVGILSTVPSGGYSSFNGTSMATPHVSGVAALVLSRIPGYTPAELKDVLLNSATPLASLSGKVATGGMLNARDALADPANFPPVLGPIGDQSVSPIIRQKTINLSATDHENDPLTYSARIIAPAHQQAAAATDEQYNFTAYQPQYDDYYRLGEKRLTTNDGRIFFITANGNLYELIYPYYYFRVTLDSRYYQNPSLLANAHPVDTSAIGSVSLLGGSPQQLRINTAAGFMGSFSVEVSVSDGNRSATRTFLVAVQTAAPVIDPVADRSMPANADTDTVDIHAEDPDGDAITFQSSIRLESPAYDLDQRYDFTAYYPQHDNLRGLSEKYLTSSIAQWFFVLPDGRVFRLSDPVEQSTLVGSAGPSAYHNPASLINVPAPGAPPATLTSSAVNANTMRLVINPNNGFRGVLRVTVTATDTIASSTRSFLVTIAQNRPQLTTPTALSVPTRVRSLYFDVSAFDLDGDSLSFTTQLENTAAAYQLDQAYNFGILLPGWHNLHGQQEKYLASAGETFYILPDGKLYRWGRSFELSVFLAQLDTYYYEDPGLLINVPAPRTLSGLTITTSSTGSASARVGVTAPAGYIGEIAVRVAVSDGVSTTTRRVVVSLINQGPVFGDLSPRTMGLQQNSISIPIALSDPQGDAITLSVTGVQSLSDLFRAFQMDRRIVEYRRGFDNGKGANEKNFRAVDGRQYYLLSNGALYEWRGSLASSVHVFTLDSSYYQDPERLALAGHVVVNYLAEKDNENGLGERYFAAYDEQLYILKPDGSFYQWNGSIDTSVFIRTYPTSFYSSPWSLVNQSNQARVVASVSGHTLTVVREANYVDTFLIQLRASDGYTPTTATQRVTVQNQLPAIAPLADRQLASTVRQDIVRFSASEPDGEPIDLRVDIVHYEKTASDVCRAARLIEYASDADNSRGVGERYFTSQSGAWYYILPNGAVYKWTGALSSSPLVGTVDTSYYQTPAELPRACVGTPPSSPGAVRIVGSDLIYDRAAGYVGTFKVVLTATDPGGSVGVASFRYSIRNSAPVLEPIENRVMAEDELFITVPLGAHDADMNTLTYSAQVFPADATPAGLVMLQHKLRGYFPQFDNYRGVNEKYLVSATGALYYLLPEGTLYRAGMTIETSVFVASLGTSYYDDPQTLLDTPSVPTSGLPAATINGNSLQLTRSSSFSGVFQVRVTVSDGMASGQGSFFVTAMISGDADEPDLGGGGAGSNSADTDGDGVNDEDEVNQGSDPFDAGSFTQPIAGPFTYSLWNSFLSMINILELVNPEDAPKTIRVLLYGIDGNVLSERLIVVPARSQYDLILNDLPGFVPDSYGLVRIEFEGLIDGRMFYYRPKPQSSEFEFSFGVPLANPSYGNTVVGFNTFQPSLAAEERDYVVANWLTIVNLSAEAKSFVVLTSAQNGSELLRRELTVPGFGRVDVDGGHGLAGPSVVGLHSIEPVDASAPYIAQLIRYGGKAPVGVMPSEYNFAFPLSARAGTGRTLHVPIGDQFSESNWVEVANASAETVSFRLTVTGSNGSVLGQIEDSLPAHGQKHFYATGFLAPGTHGVVRIEPSAANSVVAQSMFYFRDRQSGRMMAMYGSQAKQSLGRALFGSYNLFFSGMQNWLKVINTSSSAARAQVIVNSAQGSVEKVLDIAGNGIVVLPLHDFAEYRTSPDSYGTVEVRMTEGSSAYGELLRLRKLGSEIDYAAPTTVR